MTNKLLYLIFLVFLSYVISQKNGPTTFRGKKPNQAKTLTYDEVMKLNSLTNKTHVNEVLDNICIVRVVGTPSHTRVKNYLKKTMKDLGWSVESDSFDNVTPSSVVLKFENIVAKLNPNAERFLALACHYDSKNSTDNEFVGATDSAVPCAQMINLATVMKSELKTLENADVSLMFIFFDGEEAFHTWGPNDSIYGARHLAKKWHETKKSFGPKKEVTALDQIDMLVLLDLLGRPDPEFYSYFEKTSGWYGKLIAAETQLAENRLFDGYSYGKPTQTYFKPYSVFVNIEDDHIPFLQKDVPILHIIPSPFPDVWHKNEDNRTNIDMNTTENLNKIFRVFIAEYFDLNV